MRSLIGRFIIPRGRTEARTDYSPSRWAYRVERWMLTPGIRLALRAGLPFAITLTAGTVWLSDPERQARIGEIVAEARASIEERPEFTVSMMAIDGAGTELAQDIREALPLDFPMSSFDLDLDHVRETIAGLNPVRDVSVRMRPGGVLQVEVVERTPAVVWRTYDGVRMLDDTGALVSDLDHRMDRSDLPLIAGEGADSQVAEALLLIRAARPLGDRLRGLVRIGERRWDVVLDRGQRILLPETGALPALERVIALDGAQELLARDVARVDLRLPRRPTVQMNEGARKELWRIRGFEVETGQ